jgi:hypothetical protein
LRSSDGRYIDFGLPATNTVMYTSRAMPNNPSAKWYFRNQKNNRIEGPCDLIELAGLLAAGDIIEQTPTRVGEDGDWRLFRDRNEFLVAKEMPTAAILQHLEEKEKNKRLSPFRWIAGLFWLSGGVAIYVASLIIRSYGHNREGNQWLMRMLRILSFHHNGS